MLRPPLLDPPLLESKLQAAFGRYFKGNLFVKWTGDGAMVVSEELRTGDFFGACCRGVIEISRILPADLAVGSGITKGEVTQLFMFGRYEYIGRDVNEAAKLQQLTWNELCITPEVYNDLLSEGLDIRDARRIGVKGYRVNPERILETVETKGAAS